METASLPTPFKMDTLFVYMSPPLRDILPALMKPSQNQIAEIFLKTIGLERDGMGTADSAREDRRPAAARVGRAARRIRDARRQRAVASRPRLAGDASCACWTRFSSDTAFAVFYNAMPIAGVDGTIKTRMKGTPAEGNVHAKTGLDRAARSLSRLRDDRRRRATDLQHSLRTTTTTPSSAVDRRRRPDRDRSRVVSRRTSDHNADASRKQARASSPTSGRSRPKPFRCGRARARAAPKTCPRR